MTSIQGPDDRADAGPVPTASKALIRYRPFRNTDPPQIVSLWREQQADRSLAQPMSVDLFSTLVLSKPYFDNDGLIVAEADGQVVGFVHAGFGPTPQRSALAPDVGVICMLIVEQSQRRQGIGRELLSRAECYLVNQGARVILAGGLRPWAPFYLGLYGGSELPGVLASDAAAQSCVAAAGYRAQCPTRVYHLDLSRFRPLIDRRQMRIRRTTRSDNVEDPTLCDWWEACLFGAFDCTRHRLFDRGSGQPVASAISWGMELLSARWGVRAMGVVNLEVAADVRREGYATYLTGEIFRWAREQGVVVVETQTFANNAAADSLLESLGATVVDTGNVYRKLAPGVSSQKLEELKRQFPDYQSLFAAEL